MADNVAQSIKDLQKDLAALDKQLLSNNANWNKLGQTIVDSMKRGGLGIDDLFSQMKSQKDVLKLRAIIDRDALMDDVKKLQTTVDKGFKSVKVGGVEITGQRQIEQALEGYKAQLKLVPKTLAEAYDYAVKIANTLGGGNSSKASKEWLERTALTTKEKKALDDATNGYIKQTQAIQDLNRTLDELKQKRATAEAIPVTGVGKSGISYKTDASKQSALGKIDKEIEATETKINNATTAAQKFQAQLIAMQGEKKTKAMSRALGVEEAEAEVQKIPTVFDRVIAQINQRAAQSKDKFAKQLVNAEGLRNEAKNAAAEVSNELNYIWRGSQSHLLAAWRSNTGYLTDFGRQDAVNQIRLSQEYKSNLDALKTQEVRDKLTQALTRYKDALQAVITLEEQQRRSAAQYSAQERAVEGVTRRFNENEQAIARVRDRWDELNVKRQAGLVNEKDFKANSQKLLDEYDRLIAKRKEFETTDIGQSLSERLRKQQEEEKRLEADRVRSAKETSKIITEERGKQALSSLIGSPKMNAAVQQQLKYMQQIRSIGKDINALQSNKNRSAEENALLEKRKKELSDVLELQKRLNNEQKGSANLARQIDKYNQLRGKVKETTDEVKRQKTSLESMLPTLRRLASAFGVAFSVQGLVNFGRKLVETRGEFEMQQVAMRSILQNKQLADEIWDKTMQAALQSPFTAMQLTKYTKQLAAYRIETDKLFDTTKRLADVSAGLGVDMQRLILAYGQVKAANYLRASEIRQFTEAGVNILGELSTYLSKTRGEMISTAQVMDMVQKRMVTFEDVEAIFKRMTDEGGIFYNMQYVQSQTVKGQINKLHDAYDQMLNSIGKGNEGVLKNVVAALNNIVQNWRYWAAAIKSIAFGTIIASLSKLGVTLTGVNVAGIAAGKGMTKLAGGVKALGVALKGNWLTLVIGTVVSLAAELYNLNKRMESVNAEIDEQNLNLFETKERLEGYQDAIERNNKALEGSTGNEEKLKKKREENAEILAKLKNDYPQLVEGMEMQKNGVIDLTDALRKENEEIERQITLNTLMKQSSIFDENLTKDAQDLSKAYINQQQQIIAARAQARSLMVQLKQRGAEGSNQYDILKQISEINPDDLQKAYERLIELRHLLYNDIFTLNGKQPAPGTYQSLVDYYRNYLRGISDVSGSENELGKEFNKLGEYVGYELEKGLESAYKEEIEKSGLSTLQWYALNVNKVQKDVNDGVVDIYRFLRESLEKNGQAQGPGMQAYWNNIVKTNYIDPYFKAWKLGMEEAEAGGWRFPMVLPTEGGMPNIFATSKKGDSTSTSTSEDEGSKAKKTASKLISLIREMRAEYDKLSKSAYGYAKSEATVRESYKQSVKEILGKAGITDYDFTTNAGMIAALEKVKIYANKLGPEAAAEVEKYIGQLKTEMTINAQVRIREDFGRQMEEAFGNYELTLDLQKLNLPSDVLSDLFDLDTVDLSDLRRRVTTFYNELAQEGDIDRDDMKSIEGYIKKIDGMERKQQQERIKDYAKFLEYELSERAKISMEYARKIAQVQIEKFSDDEAENLKRRQKIIDGLNKEKDEKLAKQDWEDFKSMDVYVQMMEDLEKHGTVALRTMREELEKIRKNAKNLSPRALKEVVSAIEKIREIELNRSDPFRGVSEAREDVKNALKAAGVSSKAELYAEADAAEKKLVSVQQEKREVDEIVAAKKKEKELTEDIAKLAEKDVIKDVLSNDEIKDKMVALTSLMNDKEREANDIRKERENLEKEILTLSREQARLIDEESKEGTSAARKEEIKTRLGAIGNRLNELDGLIDTKTLGENIAKGIVNEIYRYIQAKGELSGLSPELLSDSRGENEQKELSDREKKLQEIQEKYQAAINAINTYNKQVARLMVFIDTWTGKVQELWSSISELSSAYEGEFGDWVSRWGGVVDTTFQQVSKLSKAFADFQAVRADYLKSATKKAADKASSAVDNMERANDTMETQANTAATQANTLAKIENANSSNLAAMGNSAVGNSAAAATPAVATFGSTLLMAMGWVGLIMAALEALFAIIKAIAGAHDSKLDKQIEEQQKKIDALKDAYARLEKQIERTWSSVTYMQAYEQQVQNIREQIDAMEAQMRAEEAKKNTDDNAVRQYQRDIQDAYDQLDELEQKSIEVFGGIGEEGYRSAAEGFVEAWKSAFLETGDGLQGLQDHFDEFLQDWFVKQGTMQAVANYYSKVWDYVNGVVKDGGLPTQAEIEQARALADEAAVQSDAFLQAIAGIFNLQGEGSLSGLAAGIQGMTEEQANILEAYWNSVRMYTASIDQNVAMIASALGVGGNSPSTNPQLQQLQLIAASVQATHQLLQSVTRSGHSLGGYGIKVFND